MTAMVRLRTAVVLALGVPCILTLAPALAGAACTEPMATARIVSIDNSVELKDAAETLFLPASLKGFVCQGDSIRVGGFSRATVAFLNSGLRLTIEQNTEWVVRQPQAQGRTLIDLIRGAILFFTSQPGALDVQTPFVNAAVQGTEFLVRVEGNRTDVAVLEGTVALENGAGRLTLTSGQSGQAVGGQAPQLVDIRPRDAVRWALYYEPILPADSREQLEQVPAADRNAQFYVRRASVMLAVGRIDEARGDITTAKGLDPRNGEAFALDAIIAVAQNDGTGALENGRRAVELSPQSVSARVAFSYAFQARFQLEAARDELLQIVPSSPAQDRVEHAAALARLAELWLSLGDLNRALNAANRAVAVAPNLARTQTVFGFAALTRLDTSAAKAAFDRAISLESKSPLARLGLGLAMIREGDLSGGRSELETAAALNVEDALIRSYLGKAYFDEKNDAQAGRQFDLAKERDPNDPTAFFYDAIRKQTLNRPVEALEDLQRSIELNDNRAVYRSRLLLDQDLAARSASLGRIYLDLGFAQAGLVAGWQSVMADPGDYSGHRFLADSYSALPRHDLARVSELLQSQLLQPVNISPVQPQLAETNLFILTGAGPSQAAFHEFGPLFNRNRLALQASGVAGGNSVLGDDVAVSGVWDRVSFSVGQFHFRTSGLRENNDQEHKIANFFGQVALSGTTSVQAEVRLTEVNKGDLELRFNPENFNPDLRQEQDANSVRLGIRHALAPTADLIGSVIFRDVGSSVENPPWFDIAGNENSYLAEFQHILRANRFSLVSGAGHFSAKQEDVFTTRVPIPEPPFTLTFSEAVENSPTHTNLYAYSHIRYREPVTFTIGASGDFFDGRQFNPKLGLIWQIRRRTTLRSALFRTFQRPTLLRDNTTATIEPTQVAGFNQVFLGPIGEDAWRYGVGVDQSLSRVLYAGVEVSKRDLKTPLNVVPPPPADPIPTVVRADWEERFARAYLNWAPDPRLALSAEYSYERIHRGDPFSEPLALRFAGSFGPEAISDLRTHRVPVRLAYFHPSGFSASVEGVRVHQSGLFELPLLQGPGFSLAPDRDSFSFVNASIGYRLPRRYGLIRFEAKNLLNEDFRFQDTDPGNPLTLPARLVVARFTLSL
jgi:tetratricopeptide (TPR) repeat protein